MAESFSNDMTVFLGIFSWIYSFQILVSEVPLHSTCLAGFSSVKEPCETNNNQYPWTFNCYESLESLNVFTRPPYPEQQRNRQKSV